MESETREIDFLGALKYAILIAIEFLVMQFK